MAETALFACSLCMHAKERDVAWLTIINGHLVCNEHVGYVQGGDWSLALANVHKWDQQMEADANA